MPDNQEILNFLNNNFKLVFQETYTIRTQNAEIIDKLDPTYNNVRHLYQIIHELKDETEKLNSKMLKLQKQLDELQKK